MKVKVANSSSRRTRENIKKSFALLLEEKKDLNKITVTDLVNKALITRSSFYTHYENIYDVAKEISDEALDMLVNNINELQNLDSINLYFDELFFYLKNNSEIYKMILSSDDPFLFIATLDKIVSKSLYDVLKNKNIKNLELNISLFIDGCFQLIIKHYRNQINYSLDEINSYMKETFKLLFLSNK